METEKFELFALACQRGKLDAVHFAQAEDVEQKINFFSFNRAQVVSTFRHGIYSCRSRALVLNERGRLTIHIGGSPPSTAASNRAVNDAIAERIIALIDA